jgi:hypothetical protein
MFHPFGVILIHSFLILQYFHAFGVSVHINIYKARRADSIVESIEHKEFKPRRGGTTLISYPRYNTKKPRWYHRGFF